MLGVNKYFCLNEFLFQHFLCEIFPVKRWLVWNMFTAGLIEDIFPEVIGLFLLITFAHPMNYLASYPGYLSLTQHGATSPGYNLEILMDSS